MALTLDKPIVATHKNDPQWIIALWFAIHGGDPAPDGFVPARRVDDIAASAIRSLAAYLPEVEQKAVVSALGR